MLFLSLKHLHVCSAVLAQKMLFSVGEQELAFLIYRVLHSIGNIRLEGKSSIDSLAH